MTEQYDLAPSSRLMRSARLLRAFFEHKLKTSLELLTKPPTAPISEGMQFDLHLSQYGIWGLRSAKPLSEKSQSEIAAMFHGLLSAMNDLEVRCDELIRLEDRMRGSSMAQMPSNVIPIRRSGGEKTTGFQTVNDKRWILRLDCLIESDRTEDIQKMALELHSQSQRVAFVDYGSLSRTARLNLSELLQMGAVSLFIPNILDLFLSEQRVLVDLIRTNTLQRPLLMVGAPITYAELRGEPAINTELLALLSRAYIKLTKPFAEYKEQGLIHYFLDSLSQNPS